MPLIPFAQFGPDRSPFDAQFCDTIQNVIPLSGGWGPFPSFIAFSLPLPEPPLGSTLIYVANGAYRLFAGTAAHLYMFDIATNGWIDKTRASGIYNTPVGVRWNFAQYGDTLFATNGQDQPQWIDALTVSQFADNAAAPKAYNVDSVGDFLFFSHLVSNQRMVQWSGLNQPFFFNPRQQSSDFQAFPDGGEIMGTAVGLQQQGLVIFSAESIREGTLALDTPLVFNFKMAVSNHGCLAPRSIVSTGAGIFYLSDDGFYKYGQPPTPIGIERVDTWFQDNVHTGDIYDVYGGEDPTRKIVYWAFRSVDSQVPNTYDTVLLYHYGLDQWSVLKPGLLLSGLVDATTPGYTLDSLSTLGPLDGLPYSLDSRTWSGSTPVIAAFDNQYRLGFFAGAPMQAVLQTGDIQLSEGTRASISGWRPLIDATYMKGNIATKEAPGDPLRWRSQIFNNHLGVIPQQVSGLFHRFELTIPPRFADGVHIQNWTEVHGVFPVDPQPDGEQ